MRVRAFALFLGLMVIGCAPSKPGDGAHLKRTPSTEVVDPWSLSANNPNQPTPALLWNGLIGLRVARDGTGINLPCFSIDEYQLHGEEKIVPLPNPLAIKFTIGGSPVDPTQASDYAQSLDMKVGQLLTKWTQQFGDAKVVIECRSVIHPDLPQVADQWTFTTDKPITVEGVSSWEGVAVTPASSGAGSMSALLSLPPAGKLVSADFKTAGSADKSGKSTRATVESNSIHFYGNADSARPTSLQRSFSFGLSPTWLGIANARGRGVKLKQYWNKPTAPLGFDKVVGDSVRSWADRWNTDIEIDGPPEDQRAVRSFLYTLRSSIHRDGGMSVSPFGLSDAMYSGHVFWDADIWVFPALALTDPDLAAEIVRYRLDTLPQAQRNFDEWIKVGRPVAIGNVPGAAPAGQGGMFAWESSVSGKETVPGPSKFESHITGDVAFNAWRAAALGLIDAGDAVRLKSLAAAYYKARSEPGPDGLEIKGVMSPDENHTGDNDLYTNLLAQWCGAGKFKLPRDAEGFLTYDHDNVRSYKQAAAVLSIYPLQDPTTEPEARKMMERFSDKVIKNGPAMSDSIHALIWARLGETQKAYDEWRESWQPFTSQPLQAFSEKRNKAVTYFTTGAAGSLQTVLYGFLGLRLDAEEPSGGAWKKELKNGAWLSIDPHLPPGWKAITFKGMKLLGKSYTVKATATGATVTPES